MSRLRYRLYVLVIIVLVWIVIFNSITTKETTPQISNELFGSSNSDFTNIWKHHCKNGGIYFPDHCRCPPNVTGEYCEIDNCTPEIDWAPTYAKQNGTEVVCQFPPSVFHCYRQDIKQRDKVRVHKLSDYSSLSDKLEFIFDYYGPWTSEDTQMLHYLLKPDDFQPKKKEPFSYHHKSLAFVIMLHTYPTVFSMHWNYLYKPYHQYVIHLDLSMEKKAINLVKLTVGNAPNVEILHSRFDGLWGGISLVYLEVAALARLVAKGGQWNHVINLSNNDFLIKPIEQFEDFMWELGKNSIIQGAIKTNSPVAERYTKIYYFCPVPQRTRIYSWDKYSPEEPSSANYAYERPEMEYKAGGWGSQWHMLSRDLAEFIVKDIRALEVLMSLKHTLIPDEFYFQLVAKSFDFPVIDNSTYRWINWDSMPLEQMVTERDIPALREAKDVYFTRKVEPKLAPLLIKELLQ